jgi:hypothetical protein
MSISLVLRTRYSDLFGKPRPCNEWTSQNGLTDRVQRANRRALWMAESSKRLRSPAWCIREMTGKSNPEAMSEDEQLHAPNRKYVLAANISCCYLGK